MYCNLKCKTLFLSVCLLLMNSIATAQDIENIAKQKPFAITGGFGLNYTSTSSSDSNRIPMPVFWGANLSLNLSIYGISIPVTAVFTNGKVNLSHSFNQFGFSPHYKWITLHAGYRQYSYSMFTVSGQTLFGGGMDVNYRKLRLGFFGGRLRKAVQVDSTMMFRQDIPGAYPVNISTENGINSYSVRPTFSRIGLGGKIGFGTPTNFVDFILFKGYDNVKSLSTPTDNRDLKPEENVVLGVNIFQRFLKHFTFGFNGAASIYTYDTNEELVKSDFQYLSVINKIIPVRLTTQAQWAAETNINISYPNFNLSGSYKRAQPYFRSMGINSFLTDLNLISIQPSWSMLKQKLRFTNLLQYQSDNLNRYKQLTTKRLMLNSSVSYQISDHWGIDLNYNGSDISQQKAKAQTADSIQSAQKSSSLTLSPRYLFSTDKISNITSLVTSFTGMRNSQIGGISNDIKNTYATLNNTFLIFRGGWNINTGLNFNNAVTSQNTLQSYGFNAGVSKALFGNSLTLSNNNTLLFNTLDGVSNGTTVSIDLNGNYNFLKRNTISIGYNYLYSPANGIYNLSDFQQNRLMISYQYNF